MSEPRTVERSEQSESHQPSASEARETFGVHADLGVVMANLARTLQRSHTSHPELLGAIVRGAGREIPGVDSAGIMLCERNRLISTAEPDSLAGILDHLQIHDEAGPSVDALEQVRTVRVDDFHHEQRWRSFTAEAVRLGVGSMLVVELFIDDKVLGCLNLYSMTPHALTDDGESLSILFAAHAAIALASAREEQNLTAALGSRDLIGQAKGILMERFKLTPDAAFALLVESSQVTHTKLRDVAYQISTTGVIPTRPTQAGP